MARKPTSVTQADIARAIRATRQAGAAEVVIMGGQSRIIVRIKPSTGGQQALEKIGEIVL